MCRQCPIFGVLATKEYPETVSKERSIVLNLGTRIREQHETVISLIIDDVDIEVILVHVVA